MTSMDRALMKAIETVEDKVETLASESSSPSVTITTHTDNPFKDKWVSILGDHTSTYEGYIPTKNETFYPNSDVDDVSKTWWHILLTKLGAKLCVNQSWNSRKVSGTEQADAHKVYDLLHRKVGQECINLDGTK